MHAALGIVIGFTFLGLAGCQSGRVPSHPEIPSPGYSLVWHDEFEGTELDTAKWSHYRPGPRRDALNSAEAVTLDGRGHLVITTSRSRITDSIAGGQPRDQILTGMISTEHTLRTTYGYFEARMKFQTQVGHWSAFWLQTPTMSNPVGDPAAAGVEIDIMEYLRNGDYADKAQHTIHWDVRTPQQQRDFASVPISGIGEGFHTFGCEWTPDVLIFYVDGRETWRTSKAIPKRDEFIILSVEVGPWADDIAKASLPDSVYVDYVRVYQRPETSVSMSLICGCGARSD